MIVRLSLLMKHTSFWPWNKVSENTAQVDDCRKHPSWLRHALSFIVIAVCVKCRQSSLSKPRRIECIEGRLFVIYFHFHFICFTDNVSLECTSGVVHVSAMGVYVVYLSMETRTQRNYRREWRCSQLDIEGTRPRDHWNVQDALIVLWPRCCKTNKRPERFALI